MASADPGLVRCGECNCPCRWWACRCCGGVCCLLCGVSIVVALCVVYFWRCPHCMKVNGQKISSSIGMILDVDVVVLLGMRLPARTPHSLLRSWLREKSTNLWVGAKNTGETSRLGRDGGQKISYLGWSTWGPSDAEVRGGRRCLPRCTEMDGLITTSKVEWRFGYGMTGKNICTRVSPPLSRSWSKIRSTSPSVWFRWPLGPFSW